MTFRNVALCLLIFASAGCRLFDDPNAVSFTNPSSEADVALPDSGPADMRAPRDMGTEMDGAMPIDMQVGDMDVDMGGDPIEIDPFTLLDLIGTEVCAYYARQDYHGDVFLGVGFRDEEGCREFFDIFLRNVLGVLARDAHLDRARINEDAVRSIVDHVRTYTGDPRVFPITDVNGIVAPLSGVGDPCSTNFACVSSPARPTTCFIANPQDCDGVCVEARRACAGVLCAQDETCLQNTCVPLLADGAPCTDDSACENQCLTDVCGTLGIGDDCTANPDDCGPGDFCRSDVSPRVCAPIGILNDPCTEDAGCVRGHYCDAVTSLCAAIEEGTPCRVDDCVEGLNCVQTSEDDSELRCFAPRPLGQFCTDDTHCEDGTYCNVNTCTKAKEIDDLCRADRECESICRYELDGDTTGKCAQFAWGLQVNDMCHVDAARCGMPLECEPPSDIFLEGICREPAPLQIGDTCAPTRPFWCPNGSTCRNDVCTEIAPAGAECQQNVECASNLCFMGKCYDRVAACTDELMP